MSNHPGSYMLRDVLMLLTQAGIWQHMPRIATQNLVVGIVDLACVAATTATRGRSSTARGAGRLLLLPEASRTVVSWPVPEVLAC